MDTIIMTGSGPKGKKIAGAMIGSAKLDWSKSDSTFLPGALCDNFTSYGAFWEKTQTKATHFLDAGAAGVIPSSVC